MRHLKTGRKLGVTVPHRKAMLRSLTLALIERETIRTTPARAKELRWYAERVVNLAKKGDVHSRRQIVKLLGSTQTYTTGENRVRKVLDRLYTHLAPRFKDRPGGCTQLIRLANRRAGDNAELCVFRYMPDPDAEKAAGKDKGAKAKKAKPEKKAKEVKAKATEDKPAKAKSEKSAKAKDKKASKE
jgi:large subunit ribosomal protein L17